MGRKLVFLNAAQRYALYEGIKSHMPKICEQKLHYKQAASMLSKELGFVVTGSHVRGAVIAMGLLTVWPTAHSKPYKRRSAGEQQQKQIFNDVMEELEIARQEVKDLRLQMKDTHTLMQKMYNELVGVPKP